MHHPSTQAPWKPCSAGRCQGTQVTAKAGPHSALRAAHLMAAHARKQKQPKCINWPALNLASPNECHTVKPSACTTRSACPALARHLPIAAPYIASAKTCKSRHHQAHATQCPCTRKFIIYTPTIPCRSYKRLLLPCCTRKCLARPYPSSAMLHTDLNMGSPVQPATDGSCTR